MIVLDTAETLFLSSGHQTTILEQSRSRVVVVKGKTQDKH
jgi:hypothetical protein